MGPKSNLKLHVIPQRDRTNQIQNQNQKPRSEKYFLRLNEKSEEKL